MTRIPPWGFVFALLTMAAAPPAAGNQTNGTAAAPSTVRSELSPIDYNFVAQANLGAPFQIDSGRIAEQTATTAGIRDYAHLMVVTHIPVVEALAAILRHKRIAAPPATLLQGAYGAMIASLKADGPAMRDRDYVKGQVEYQEGNAALFQYEIQNGSDPELKEFARQTLRKIEDHLSRALSLAKAGDVTLHSTPGVR